MVDLKNKILLLLTTINLTIFSTTAYHQDSDSPQGSALSLPTYETLTEQVLYLAAPLFLLAVFLQQLFEAIVDEKYIQASYKDAADYRAYTTVTAIVITLTLAVSRIFHSLHSLSQLQMLALITLMTIATIAISQREQIREKLQN